MSKNDFLNNVESLRVAVCDLNGTLRGKRMPANQLSKAIAGEIRLPLSIVGVDIWGEDIIDDASTIFQNGDVDGISEFTGRGPLPVNWTSTPTAILPLWLKEENGQTFGGDPRRVLADIVEKYKARGLTPVMATELEFYLFDKTESAPKPPISPLTGKRLSTAAILSISELDDFDGFFNDVYEACEAYDIPADTTIAENGCAQFEINLLHVDDPLKAADDAIFFKHIVKGIARKHNLGASFMAKPYGSRSGNGFHVHFSLLDEQGNNVFDNGGDEGSDTMLHAVGGLLQTMSDSALIFAPHLNSFKRLLPGTHAPTAVAWGYENRTSAIRIPGGSNKARRIEHRVAGADANPYLVISSILAGALKGIEEKIQPSEPIEGNSYDADRPQLPATWAAAIDAFSKSEVLPEILNATVCNMFAACKRQESNVFTNQITNFEYQTYLEVV